MVSGGRLKKKSSASSEAFVAFLLASIVIAFTVPVSLASVADDCDRHEGSKVIETLKIDDSHKIYVEKTVSFVESS
jgi:biopolymer transport protein ExbD